MRRHTGTVPSSGQRMGHRGDGLQLHGNPHHALRVRGVHTTQRHPHRSGVGEGTLLRAARGNFDVLLRYLQSGAEAQRYRLRDSKVSEAGVTSFLFIVK